MRLVLTSNRNAQLYAYWVTARGSKPMPSQAEMQPDLIPLVHLPELPYIYIAQIMRDHLGTWFKFRLMGASVTERLKQAGTGKMLLDLQIGGWEEEWRKNLVFTVDSKLPVVDESTITTETGTKLAIEHLALPISDDGINVDHIFGCIDFIGHTEKTLQGLIPELDWKKISSVELAKRIIISNLRIQV